MAAAWQACLYGQRRDDDEFLFRGGEQPCAVHDGRTAEGGERLGQRPGHLQGFLWHVKICICRTICRDRPREKLKNLVYFLYLIEISSFCMCIRFRPHYNLIKCFLTSNENLLRNNSHLVIRIQRVDYANENSLRNNSYLGKR